MERLPNGISSVMRERDWRQRDWRPSSPLRPSTSSAAIAIFRLRSLFSSSFSASVLVTPRISHMMISYPKWALLTPWSASSMLPFLDTTRRGCGFKVVSCTERGFVVG